MKNVTTIILSLLLIISASFYSFASIYDYETETVDEKKKMRFGIISIFKLNQNSIFRMNILLLLVSMYQKMKMWFWD